MTNTNTTYIAAELAGMKAEVVALTKRVEMCSAAHSHLKGYALAKMHKLLDNLTREVSNQSRRAGFADVVSNFSTDIVPGAIEIRYKDKPVGWIGLPVLEMSPALKTWLEKSQEKTSDDEWNSIVQRYAEPRVS